MDKIVLFLAFSLLIASCKHNSPARGANETEENIYKAADSMMTAFKEKDWLTFARFNHPALVKMVGGEENFVDFMQDQIKQIPDTAIKAMNVGKILQVLNTGNDIQCIVEQNMVMVLDKIKISSTSYLIGESLDAGKTWTFLDASGTSFKMPKDIKPDISPELKIPAKKQHATQL